MPYGGVVNEEIRYDSKDNAGKKVLVNSYLRVLRGKIAVKVGPGKGRKTGGAQFGPVSPPKKVAEGGNLASPFCLIGPIDLHAGRGGK